MSTDIYARSLISVGEELNASDLSDLAARTLAIVFDQTIGPIIGDVTTPSIDPTFSENVDLTACPYAFAMTGTAARPVQGSANNQVKISKGTLMQAIAAPDGTEPKLLAFTFGGTDQLTIANGDPTNPRVDIIQMSLSYLNDSPTARDFQDAATRANTTSSFSLRRRVQCTLSIKQGTPAASPTYPLADAGSVIIAGIVVGANYTGAAALATMDAAGSVAVLHDQRLPIGIDSSRALPQADPGVYAKSTMGNSVVATAAANNSYVTAVYGGGAAGRVLGVSNVSLTKTSAGSSPWAIAALAQSQMVDAGGGFGILSEAPVFGLQVKNLAACPALVGSGTAWAYRIQSISGFVHAPGSGPTVQTSTAGVGPPVWTSGQRCPIDPNTVLSSGMMGVCLMLQAPNTGSPAGQGMGVGPTRFWVARGVQ